MIRILLAEGSAIAREGLKQILAGSRDMAVSGEAGNAQSVLNEAAKNSYDVVLLGTSIPGNGWLETVKDLKNQNPNLPVLILSAHADEDNAKRAFRAGASGYLTKECDPDELLNAVRKVASGGKHVGASLGEQLASDMTNGSEKMPHDSLSDRERQVMELLASGKTVSEIAGEMSLSVKTVSTYRSRVLEKLNLKNNIDLAGYHARFIAAGRAAPAGATDTGSPTTSPSAAQEAARKRARSVQRSRWILAAVAVVFLTTAAITWRLRPTPPPGEVHAVAPPAADAPFVVTPFDPRKHIEVRHDDGAPDQFLYSDFGGYLVHFAPPSLPFTVNEIRVLGGTFPSERTEFEVQIWDGEQKVIYSARLPVTKFPTVTSSSTTRSDSSWIQIPVPDVEIRSDFFVHLFVASAYKKGIVIGADNSTVNLHSNLTVESSDGYKIRDGWTAYGTNDASWWTHKENVNWMIRVEGQSPPGSEAVAGAVPLDITTPPAPAPLPPVPAAPTSSNATVAVPAAPAATAPPTVPAQPRPLPPRDAFMKGFHFADFPNVSAPPSTWGLYRAPGADESLKGLAATGTNWISLLVNVGQETAASTKISRTQPVTATDAELRRIVDLAHSQGMRVNLLMGVQITNDPVYGRHDIGKGFASEDQWQAWFAAYRENINHYATLSQEAGIDMMCIGDSTLSTTHRDEDWRRVVSEARERFKGPLTYAALFASGPLADGEDARMTWWDALDYIGWQPFYPLTGKNDPTIEELKAAWTDKGYLDFIENLSKKFDRPVIAIEIGYESKDGTNKFPLGTPANAPVDLKEQADCYQAAFEVLGGKPWMAGIFWWQWSGDISKWAGGPKDNGSTPQGKPAEDVVKKYYLQQ